MVGTRLLPEGICRWFLNDMDFDQWKKGQRP